MNNTNIIKGLNDVVEYFKRLSFAADSEHKQQIEYLKNSIKDGIHLINEQEIIIEALMGEYGDSCGINGCGGVIND